MEVGKEFSSWIQFSSALQCYSKENKVSYLPGICRTVESANKSGPYLKLPVKLKYSYIRLICNYSYKHKNSQEAEGNQTNLSSCHSSILVLANVKRRTLFIQEANFIHNHESVDLSFSDDEQIDRERLMKASVLLNIGVSPICVRDFIFNCHNTITVNEKKDESLSKESNSVVDVEYFSFIDEMLAVHPECHLEMIEFNSIPGAMYLQTSEMKEKSVSFNDGSLQIITHKFPQSRFKAVCIIGVDEELNTHLLAVFISPCISNKIFQHFIEFFVGNNRTCCDSCKGIVVDCCLENAQFIQYLMPQANIAWSRSFILQQFEEIVTKSVSAAGSSLSILKELMNSKTEQEYNRILKLYLALVNSVEAENFLTEWDSSKDLWVQYKIASSQGLHHQKSAIEMDYINSLCKAIKLPTTFRDVVKCFISFPVCEDVYNFKDVQREELDLNSCNAWYKSLCHLHAAEAVICQIAVADISDYEANVQNDLILVKRLDAEDEFSLSKSGRNCTCKFYVNTELPCQHIFAWLKMTGKSYCDESLIPLKWKIMGKGLQKCLSGSETSSNCSTASIHDKRVVAIQCVIREILFTCESHSFNELGDDLILLKKVLSEIKKSKLSCEQKASSSILKQQKSASSFHEDNSQSAESIEQNNHNLMNMKDKTLMSPSKPSQSSVVLPTERRHNLRTNIKHKFVSRGPVTPSYEKEKKSHVSRSSVGELVGDNEELENGCIASNIIESSSTGRLKKQRVTHDFETNNLSVQASLDHDKDLRQIQGEEKKQETLELRRKDIDASTKRGLKRCLSQENVEQPEETKPNQRSADVNIGETEDEDDGDDTEDEKGSDGYDDESGDDSQSVDKDVIIQQRNEELRIFMENLLVNEVQQVIQEVSLLGPLNERMLQEQEMENCLKTPTDYLIASLSKEEEALDRIIEYLGKTCFGYDTYAYKVAACVILKAFNVGASLLDTMQTIHDWPNHLPEIVNYDDSGANDQNLTNLTVCGHKLSSDDINTLKSDLELSPRIIHAYLEILAQRLNGKLFVIPFEIVHHWQSGNFSHMIFKKVHFKTFDYLVLPIHCGSEFFNQDDSESSESLKPYWMALIADVRNKTVSVLNPRSEDKYAIAANGYMLQWRRYMQIRSVHTGEMLLTWNSVNISCTKQILPNTSGALLLMNVESVINNVPPAVMVEAHIKRYLHYIAATLRDMDRETTVLCVGGPECQKMAARDADWLQCENCHAWWHRACSGHLDQNNIFYCTSCQQRIISINSSTQGICGTEEDHINEIEMMEEEEDKENDDSFTENNLDEDSENKMDNN